MVLMPGAAADFNPRSPGGERHDDTRREQAETYFNPRSPGGERRERMGFYQRNGISIHAPRVGSDGNRAYAAPPVNISIHAPRVGSDAKMDIFAHDMGKIIHFQH